VEQMNSRAGEREKAKKFERLHCGLLISCSTAHLRNELNEKFNGCPLLAVFGKPKTEQWSNRSGEREEASKFKRLHCSLLISCSTAHLGDGLNEKF
jgi:hypothetical protein